MQQSSQAYYFDNAELAFLHLASYLKAKHLFFCCFSLSYCSISAAYLRRFLHGIDSPVFVMTLDRKSGATEGNGGQCGQWWLQVSHPAFGAGIEPNPEASKFSK